VPGSNLKGWRAWLLLAPAMGVVLGLFAGGLWLGFVESLGPEGGLGHYRALLGSREFRVSLGFTAWVATAATLLSAGAGMAIALGVRRAAFRSGALASLLQVPVALPHLAIAFILIQLLSPGGLAARAAFAAGLIAAPAGFPELTNDAYGLGIIFAYVLKEGPFVALMVLAALARIDDGYHDVARTLGASASQRFRRVTLPLVLPSLAPAAVFVFAYIFSAFEVPFLLGRQYPAMLAVKAQRSYMAPGLSERPEAVATAVLLSLATGALVWIYLRTARGLLKSDKPVIF
jgi:putative spermidine/putrescine transport system permease protein